MYGNENNIRMIKDSRMSPVLSGTTGVHFRQVMAKSNNYRIIDRAFHEKYHWLEMFEYYYNSITKLLRSTLNAYLGHWKCNIITVLRIENSSIACVIFMSMGEYGN